jgi:hypothetical protein
VQPRLDSDYSSSCPSLLCAGFTGVSIVLSETIDFYISTLIPGTLLNSLIIHNSS